MNEKINFEKYGNETQLWVAEIAEYMHCPGKTGQAYSALKAVLHTIRDRSTIQEVFQLSAQLPVLIRGIYFEGYKPAGKPDKMNAEEFLQKIKQRMGPSAEVPPSEALKAVLTILYEKTSPGEMEDIKGLMPKDIRNLWSRFMQDESEFESEWD